MATAPPSAFGSGTPPQRGWFSRNWFWFVPTIVLLPVLTCGLCCGGVFYVMMNTVKNSAVYTQAVAEVKGSPEVQAALGEPITESWWVAGNVSEQFGGGGVSGVAFFTFQVSGPNDGGLVAVEANKHGDDWTIETLLVTVQGSGEVIEVIGSADEYDDYEMGDESHMDDDTDETMDDVQEHAAPPDPDET